MHRLPRNSVFNAILKAIHTNLNYKDELRTSLDPFFHTFTFVDFFLRFIAASFHLARSLAAHRCTTHSPILARSCQPPRHLSHRRRTFCDRVFSIEIIGPCRTLIKHLPSPMLEGGDGFVFSIERGFRFHSISGMSGGDALLLTD